MKNVTSKYSVVEGSDRTALPGAQAVGLVNPNVVIEVLLKLRRKKQLPALDSRPAKFMSRESLAADYGASSQDIDKVVKVFTKLGLNVESTNAATRTVVLTGPASTLEEAFQIKLFDYTHEDGSYRGRVGPVQVPSELSDIVVAVFGLDNRRVAHRRRRTTSHEQPPMELSGIPSAWYRSGDLAKHYNFPPGDGSGETVGILEFGGGYFPSDLASYCKLANISTPKVIPISVDGTSTSAVDGAEGEVMLDIEVVAGVCPKAAIAVYFAKFSERGWIKALDAAMQDHINNPTVISVSWGYAEDAYIWTKQAMTQVNETLQEAAHLGVTVCIAAGDDGSSDAVLTDGHAHADFPSTSPYVLAVGGTTIPKKGSDIVWFEGDGLRPQQQGDPDGGSTGGAVSTVFARPAWQSGITIKSVNPNSINGRVTPDLAANADWTASPYLLVVDGKAEGNGGTSAATPLVASLIARINAQLPPGKRVGYLTPVLYQKSGAAKTSVGAACCTDVTSGNNKTAKVGGYSAGPGFDAASGWGTPDGVKLLNALKAIV